MEQELLILPEHPSSTPVICAVLIEQFLVFCGVF